MTLINISDVFFQLKQDAAHAVSRYRNLQAGHFRYKDFITQRFYQDWYGFDEFMIGKLVDG